MEFGGVSKIEFEFEFLFQPWLKFTVELECEFDFVVKSEFAVEVVPESGASRKWTSSSSCCFNPGSSLRLTECDHKMSGTPPSKSQLRNVFGIPTGVLFRTRPNRYHT